MCWLRISLAKLAAGDGAAPLPGHELRAGQSEGLRTWGWAHKFLQSVVRVLRAAGGLGATEAGGPRGQQHSQGLGAHAPFPCPLTWES